MTLQNTTGRGLGMRLFLLAILMLSMPLAAWAEDQDYVWINRDLMKRMSKEQYDGTFSYHKIECNNKARRNVEEFLRSSRDDNITGPLAAYRDGQNQAESRVIGVQSFNGCMFEKGWELVPKQQ
jgi:secreted PhoX family phosphatase